MIAGVHAEYLDFFWQSAWALLSRAFAHNHGEFSEEFVYNGIKCRNLQLWLGLEEKRVVAAGVTRLDRHPEKLTCFVLGLAAEPGTNYRPYVEFVEKWAKHMGAADIEFAGRKGLEKLMHPQGYTFRYAIIGKKLEAGVVASQED